MYDSHHVLVTIEYWEGHDPVPLHETHGRARQLLRRCRLRRPGHDVANTYVEELVRLLHEPSQIPCGDDAGQRLAAGLYDRDGAPLLGEQHHALPHWAVRGEDRQIERQHDVPDAQQQLASQDAAGMQRGEILAAKALDFEQRYGERVTQRERDGCARGRREGFGAGFIGDRGIEHDRRLPAQRRVGITDQRDDRYAETLQLIDEAEELVGGAALRQDDADVVPAHDTEVAVQRIDGM